MSDPQATLPPEPATAKDVRSAQADVIKLLNDWSKWLITVELAAITVVGTFVLGDIRYSCEAARNTALAFAFFGLLLFGVSILYAAILLSSLPDVLQQVYGLPTVEPEWCAPIAFVLSAVRLACPWLRKGNLASLRSRQPGIACTDAVTDVYASHCRYLKIPVHDTLHGQYGCFLLGLLRVLVAVGISAFWRAPKPENSKTAEITVQITLRQTAG